MIDWIRKHDVITRGLSLVVAVLLWMYVVNNKDDDIKRDYTQIGVQVLGVDTLRSNGLTIIGGADTKVNVKLIGKRDKIVNVTKDKLVATVDVSNITAAGTYNLSYLVNTNTDGVQVLDKNPTQFELVIDRIVTKSVPVELDVQGTLPEGYLLEDTAMMPDAVDVQGPEKELENISHAVATLNVSELKQTTTVKLTYVLMNEKGSPVNMTNLITPSPSISVTATVRKAGDVPLIIDVTPIPGVPESAISYTIEPASIRVTGSTETLATINNIKLGSVSLATLVEQGKNEMTFPLILPNGVTAEDAPAQVTVKFDLSGIAQKTVQVPGEQFTTHEGFTYQTESISIKLVGTEQAINALTAADLIVDFDAAELTEDGTRTVVAIIGCEVQEVAVLGKYQLVITKETPQ